MYISLDIYLLKIKGKFVPYTVHGPIRGFNKNGVMVWRSYKTAAEAFENLLPHINMLVVTDVTNMLRPHRVCTVASIEEFRERFDRVFIVEEDADHPGFFDAMDTSGTLYTIKPMLTIVRC